jgi:hypothetical protein
MKRSRILLVLPVAFAMGCEEECTDLLEPFSVAISHDVTVERGAYETDVAYENKLAFFKGKPARIDPYKVHCGGRASGPFPETFVFDSSGRGVKQGIGFMTYDMKYYEDRMEFQVYFEDKRVGGIYKVGAAVLDDEDDRWYPLVVKLTLDPWGNVVWW